MVKVQCENGHEADSHVQTAMRVAERMVGDGVVKAAVGARAVRDTADILGACKCGAGVDMRQVRRRLREIVRRGDRS